MVNKFRYNFDENTGIFYKNYYGKITLDDIQSSWNRAIADKIIPSNTRGFILDYREASFEIDVRESHRIGEYYRQHLNVFGGKRIAIVTDTPKDIVIPILVESRDKGYSSHPFSTIEGAVQWVLG